MASFSGEESKAGGVPPSAGPPISAEGGDEPGLQTGSHPTHRLTPSITISDNSSEVFSVRFSPDGRFLAAGCGDGSIRVFNIMTGRLSYNLQGGSSTAMPTTSIRWRPAGTAEFNKTRNVLIASNAAGVVQHWHVTSGKLLHTTRSPEKNQIFCVDYRADGSAFAAAGKDKTIRVYDETTKEEIVSMVGGTGYSTHSTPGHSNRIFSLKFHPLDSNTIVSGGWDNTVQVWDVRVGYAVRSIYGPHICGDSLDLDGNTIVTGSWRPDKQLELWDFTSGKLMETIPWSYSAGGQAQACMLYATQFSKVSSGIKFIAAGGSGTNEAKVFDYTNGNKLVGTVAGLARGVFTVDWSPTTAKVAVAGGDSAIRIIDVMSMDNDEN